MRWLHLLVLVLVAGCGPAHGEAGGAAQDAGPRTDAGGPACVGAPAQAPCEACCDTADAGPQGRWAGWTMECVGECEADGGVL